MSGTERTKRFLAERSRALRSALAARRRAAEVEDDDAPAHEKPGDRSRPRDERDLRLARLERELAQEKARADELERAAADARFKIQVLETSYGKQLADARAQARQAEVALTDERSRIEALERDHETALRRLAQARAALVSRSGRVRAAAVASLDEDPAAAAAELLAGDWLRMHDGSMTINDLVADSALLEQAAREAEEPTQHETAESVDEEERAGDMLAPESMLPVSDKDDT